MTYRIISELDKTLVFIENFSTQVLLRFEFASEVGEFDNMLVRETLQKLKLVSLLVPHRVFLDQRIYMFPERYGCYLNLFLI